MLYYLHFFTIEKNSADNQQVISYIENFFLKNVTFSGFLTLLI